MSKRKTVNIPQAARLLGLSREWTRDLIYRKRLQGAKRRRTLRGPVWSIPLGPDGKPVVLPGPRAPRE